MHFLKRKYVAGRYWISRLLACYDWETYSHRDRMINNEVHADFYGGGEVLIRIWCKNTPFGGFLITSKLVAGGDFIERSYAV